jgi:hypothetical protein
MMNRDDLGLTLSFQETYSTAGGSVFEQNMWEIVLTGTQWKMQLVPPASLAEE